VGGYLIAWPKIDRSVQGKGMETKLWDGGGGCRSPRLTGSFSVRRRTQAARGTYPCREKVDPDAKNLQGNQCLNGKEKNPDVIRDLIALHKNKYKT